MGNERPPSQEERAERKRKFVTTPNPDGPRRWLIEGTDYTVDVFQPRDQPFGRGEVVEVVEASVAQRAGEGEAATQYRWLLERLHAEEWPMVKVIEGNRFWGRIEVVSPPALSSQRAGEPPTPDEAERLARERDEALDLIEKAWNDGPTFKTIPLGDWLRERGRGPARAALDAARQDS